MRALLDEQVPIELADLITGADPVHEVLTVASMGWNGLKNGIGLVVLHAFRARIRELAPLAPKIAAALHQVRPGEIIHLHAPVPGSGTDVAA